MHHPYVAAALVSVQRTELERQLAHRWAEERTSRRRHRRRRGRPS
jgi:hypothetical protein